MSPYPSARAQLGAFAWLLALAMLPACKPAGPAEAPGTPAQAGSDMSSVTNKEASNVADQAHEKQAVAPPAPDAVLYFIYKTDGDGATSYEVDFGSWVGYWQGHEFDLGGKRYFTGFGYKTPEKEGEQSDAIEGVAEGEVAISQATFVLETKAGKTAWSLIDSDGFVGAFGRNEKPAEIDKARQLQDFKTQDGRLVLAVPTREVVSGVVLSAYALFLFDPQDRDQARGRHWSYVGSIGAGEDNSAACAEGEVMPCVSSTGKLEFAAANGGGLPDLRVSLAGTTIASPGKTRDLSAADAVTYRYDSSQSIYQP